MHINFLSHMLVVFSICDLRLNRLTTGSLNMVEFLLYFDSVCHNAGLFTVFVACQHSAVLQLNFMLHICFQ